MSFQFKLWVTLQFWPRWKGQTIFWEPARKEAKSKSSPKQLAAGKADRGNVHTNRMDTLYSTSPSSLKYVDTFGWLAHWCTLLVHISCIHSMWLLCIALKNACNKADVTTHVTWHAKEVIVRHIVTDEEGVCEQEALNVRENQADSPLSASSGLQTRLLCLVKYTVTCAWTWQTSGLDEPLPQ